jgi:hypothetical protein
MEWPMCPDAVQFVCSSWFEGFAFQRFCESFLVIGEIPIQKGKICCAWRKLALVENLNSHNLLFPASFFPSGDHFAD